MTVIAPSDPLHLSQFVHQAYDRPGPVYIRLGRGNDPIVYPKDQVVEIGKAIVVGDGSDATIVSTGVMLREALIAASRLAESGISARVIDMHTIRPLDSEVVARAARETGVAECIAESGAACRLTRLGIPDVFSIIGPPPELYRHHGYDATGIERTVQALLGV
jgi:transketolase